ncbi:hypothetical protein G6F31_017703 [Rhizopus arrhizus]|nr:hypothetical protein G6F31_017703 [Rhizopus arrhizus]
MIAAITRAEAASSLTVWISCGNSCGRRGRCRAAQSRSCSARATASPSAGSWTGAGSPASRGYSASACRPRCRCAAISLGGSASPCRLAAAAATACRDAAANRDGAAPVERASHARSDRHQAGVIAARPVVVLPLPSLTVLPLHTNPATRRPAGGMD